jgi:hypothetical protein
MNNFISGGNNKIGGLYSNNQSSALGFGPASQNLSSNFGGGQSNNVMNNPHIFNLQPQGDFISAQMALGVQNQSLSNQRQNLPKKLRLAEADKKMSNLPSEDRSPIMEPSIKGNNPPKKKDITPDKTSSSEVKVQKKKKSRNQNPITVLQNPSLTGLNNSGTNSNTNIGSSNNLATSSNKPPLVGAIEAEQRFREDQILNQDMRALHESVVSQINERIEKQVNEKLLQMNTQEVTSILRSELRQIVKEGVSAEFRNQFESSVTPCFEKYLKTMFEQVNKTYEKGFKFYQDKIMIEETKSSHIKQSLNESLGIFSQMANTLNEQAIRNQKAFRKMEGLLEDRKQQNDRAIHDQLSELAAQQSSFQKQLSELQRATQQIMTSLNKGSSNELDTQNVKSEEEDEDAEDQAPQSQQQTTIGTSQGQQASQQASQGPFQQGSPLQNAAMYGGRFNMPWNNNFSNYGYMYPGQYPNMRQPNMNMYPQQSMGYGGFPNFPFPSMEMNQPIESNMSTVSCNNTMNNTSTTKSGSAGTPASNTGGTGTSGINTNVNSNTTNAGNNSMNTPSGGHEIDFQKLSEMYMNQTNAQNMNFNLAGTMIPPVPFRGYPPNMMYDMGPRGAPQNEMKKGKPKQNTPKKN